MPSLHDYDVKMPNFMFLWRTLTSYKEFFYLSLNLSAVSKKSTPGKFSYIWHFPRIGINATYLSMKKREFTLKVTFSLLLPLSTLKLPFYYILSTFNSKMDAENSLLELDAVNNNNNTFNSKHPREVFQELFTNYLQFIKAKMTIKTRNHNLWWYSTKF